ELTESGTSEVPKYQTLIRKETRVRADQETALAQLRRQVSQRRTTRGGERITENTLIRIAIDLLLSRSDDLAGNTEDELRRSVANAMAADQASREEQSG